VDCRLSSAIVTTPSDPSDPNQGYQSGLPQFPAAPPPAEYGQQRPVYEPPKEIVASFWCYLGGALVGLLSGLLFIGQKQALLDTLRNQNTTNLSDADLQAAANIAVVLVVVIAVILAGLYALFAFKLKAGRNWARIVLTIVAALNLLSLVSGRGGSAVGYVGELAVIAGAVLSYLPNSSAYITAVKASRYRG